MCLTLSTEAITISLRLGAGIEGADARRSRSAGRGAENAASLRGIQGLLASEEEKTWMIFHVLVDFPRQIIRVVFLLVEGVGSGGWGLGGKKTWMIQCGKSSKKKRTENGSSQGQKLVFRPHGIFTSLLRCRTVDFEVSFDLNRCLSESLVRSRLVPRGAGLEAWGSHVAHTGE